MFQGFRGMVWSSHLHAESNSSCESQFDDPGREHQYLVRISIFILEGPFRSSFVILCCPLFNSYSSCKLFYLFVSVPPFICISAIVYRVASFGYLVESQVCLQAQVDRGIPILLLLVILLCPLLLVKQAIHCKHCKVLQLVGRNVSKS